MCRVVAHRGPVDPGARNGEGRVEREAGLDGRIGLVKSAEPRESNGQAKMGFGIVSIGLDRSPTPQHGLLAIAEVIFRNSGLSEPRVSRRIAWAQAQRLANVSLGFLGATGKNLGQPDKGVGVGEISIQRQRMLTLGDALLGALRQYST